MKKNHILVALAIIISIFLMSCETKKDDPTDGSGNDSTNAVVVTGKVVATESGDNLSGAIIKISDGAIVKGTTTNSEGEFSTSFEMESDRDLTVIAFKAGYFQDTTSIFAIVNTTAEVPIFQLSKDESSNAGGTSGIAASINLASQSAISIGVKESGAIESAEIIFEVRDSSGILIDESNSVELSFMFGANPGGGEYLYPASAMTNALGKAAVTLNTGTIAGVVQIIAETTFEGQIIRSKPILIAVHGGFPVQDLFYVFCEKLNYPSWGIINEDITVTALLGDKYHNPVRPGTSVYFTTNSGVIFGSDQTDDFGSASVSLRTEPWPDDPVYGAGFFTVTASTGTEEGNTIFASSKRLFSGFPLLDVSPVSFSIENGGSETLTYTVADVNGNPMSEGQTVKVAIESEFIDVGGATEIKFPDTQSRSFTSFSFVVFDTKSDSIHAETVTIEIESSGPNGENKIILTGSGL